MGEKQIGYLERDMAAQLVDDLTDFSAFVAGVGRPTTSRYRGVALLIVVNDGEDAASVEACARRALAEDRDISARPARQRGQRSRTADPTDRTIMLAVIVIIALAAVIGIALRLLL